MKKNGGKIFKKIGLGHDWLLRAKKIIKMKLIFKGVWWWHIYMRKDDETEGGIWDKRVLDGGNGDIGRT